MADSGHHHLTTLAVSTVDSYCHVTMRTGENMQRHARPQGVNGRLPLLEIGTKNQNFLEA